MFMIATIQSIVAGIPTHAGSAWIPMNGNVKRSTQIPNATGIAAATSWPPSFCHQRSPRKSSSAPTTVATAAPSRSPRVSLLERQEGERRHEDPEEEREPAEPRDRQPVDAPLARRVDRAEQRAPRRPTAGVSSSTSTKARPNAPQHLRRLPRELSPHARLLRPVEPVSRVAEARER